MAVEFFKTLLGRGKPQRPAGVPTDDVLPMYDFDSRPQVRDIIIGWTMRFDEILDADKLNAALSRLLEIGDWKKLGGRLRENVSMNDFGTGKISDVSYKLTIDYWQFSRTTVNSKSIFQSSSHHNDLRFAFRTRQYTWPSQSTPWRPAYQDLPLTDPYKEVLISSSHLPRPVMRQDACKTS